MNLKYEKPVICFESFELSTAICGSCGAGSNSGSAFGRPYFGSPTTCYYGDSNGGMFSCEACEDYIPEDLDGSFYCYNNPDSSSAVFSS